MSAIIDEALTHLDGMNTSSSAPHPYDESSAKELCKFLNDEGVPLPEQDIRAYGAANGWNPKFTDKIARWADKINSGGSVVIKFPNSLSEEYKEELRKLK
ncbi:DUF1889 family protein [Hafnia alvei]|uniref:DUF1889 family protein n=1 Tax=Hafnia alvei TaxID=569 RepID=UPI002DB6720A|nr:DUF1889 family protein [Hafnia alvei]MEB7890673.1 DUF1889 family protein [Hafnia alvei]